MKTAGKLMAAIGLLVPLLCVSSALGTVYTFGSNNDGLAGFTQTAGSATAIWTTNADSVQYRNQDNGTLNSSFLRDIILDRSPGKSYYMEGTLIMTDGYADDNNRVGMYLFGDAAAVPDQNEVGAIGLIFNTDDSSTGGPPGNNADDALFINVGIDNGALVPQQLRDQTPTPYAQDLFGTEITFGAKIDFVGSNIDILATLTEADGTVTSNSVTVAAADYTGDYFGFVTRARARNYVEGGQNSPEGRSLPWVMDYESFSVIPEPVSIALLGLGGLALLHRRRRARGQSNPRGGASMR